MAERDECKVAKWKRVQKEAIVRKLVKVIHHELSEDPWQSEGGVFIHEHGVVAFGVANAEIHEEPKKQMRCFQGWLKSEGFVKWKSSVYAPQHMINALWVMLLSTPSHMPVSEFLVIVEKLLWYALQDFKQTSRNFIEVEQSRSHQQLEDLGLLSLDSHEEGPGMSIFQTILQLCPSNN